MTRRVRLSVERLEWRDIPSGVPTSWAPRGSGGGGSLFAPQVNPTNAADIYVSSDMSELFHTTDAGATWATTDFREIQGNHESRVQFTDDPNVRYCLDYSTIDGIDLIRPSKTTDGGLNWTPLTADPTDGGAFYLYADPANKSRLFVTDYTRLYYSGDGGQTFTLKYTTPDSGAGLLVGGAFWDGANISVGTNAGLLRSTNGGTLFAVSAIGGIPASQAMISFAGAKAGATTRFVAVTYNAADVYAGLPGYDNGGSNAGVYTLDVGQANWTPRTLPASVWPFYTATAAGDINTLYVAGGSSGGVPTVYKSTNGGGAWASVLNTSATQNVATGWSGSGGDRGWTYGELAMGFTVSASNPNVAVITDYGFAHLTTDGGSTWQALYVQPADRNPAGSATPPGRAYHSSGLDNTTAWQVSWADANKLLIANSDVRGQRSTDGGQSFGFNYTGHTHNSMYRATVAANGTVYAATGTVHDLYQSTYLTDARIDGGSGAVLFSANQGQTWQTMHSFTGSAVWVATDPANANRLYASIAHSTQGGIWVTSNANAGAGSTWTKLTAPPRTEGHAFNILVLNDGTLVASFSGRRTTNFTASSGVFVSTTGGSSWVDRSDAAMQYWTKDVVVDPFDATQNTWYAGVFSGWGGAANDKGGLYKTTNRGVSWTKVIDSTQVFRVTSLTFNPNDQNEAFLTSETDGLWYANNMRAAVPTFAPVASYPFRQPERVFFNPYNPAEIWVTSFGNGVRVGTTAAPPTVTGTTINGGVAQRSSVTTMTVAFDTTVTIQAGAFSLKRVGLPNGAAGDNALVGTVGFTTQTVNGVTVATLTFSGANTTAGSLDDGNWTLTVDRTKVSSTVGGVAMAADATRTNIKRLFGDQDGDGDNDSIDLARFRLAFGSTSASGNYQSYFDFDGDGDVDAIDLARFRQRFGWTL